MGLTTRTLTSRGLITRGVKIGTLTMSGVGGGELGAVSKKFFSALWTSVGSKNKGVPGAPLGPSPGFVTSVKGTCVLKI